MNHQMPIAFPNSLYYRLTYYPRCLILLAKYRNIPKIDSRPASLGNTLAGIARMQVRPHWLRG
jgi:hypothetical protein